MFENMMNNDPRTSYVHQTNLLGEPPPGPPTTGTPPNTPDTTGDGLLYSVLNPLLAEYNEYFTSATPYEQLTLGSIANVLAEQQAWNKANTGQVSGYIEGNQVTVQNSGTEAVTTPLTGVTSVGSSYGGIQSGWTSAATGTSTYTAATSWPTAPEPVQQEPQGSWVGKVGSAGYLLADWDGTQDVSDMPGVTATLVEGSRSLWALNTGETRGLQGPEGTTRNAATYYGANQIKLQLNFTAAYSGGIHLYAVDWSKLGRRESITVNDGSGPRTVLINSEFTQGAWVSFPVNVVAGGTVTITVARTAGTNAVLSGVFLGGEGSPPATMGAELSKGGWVNGVGSAGYDLAAWDGTVGDVSNMPNVSLNLQQGTRYRWGSNTTDARALSDPDQLTRNAAAYYDPNQIRLQLGFKAAYSGTISLYAVDWDELGRREMITVNGQTAELSSSFSKGAWVSFPITVAAGGTVTITVDRTAGPNAVLSGIFLGGSGAPPAATVSNTPQGSWVNEYGSSGYLLADWDGTQDLSNLPAGVTANVVKGSRSLWSSNTTEARALQGPDGLTRNAATYYDANEVEVQLTFTNSYSGNISLYAMDWSKLTRREMITVNGQTAVLSNDFSEGAWVSFPISVAAGGTVTITADRLAGPNAVLSGIFLGGTGAPLAAPVSSSPQGSWVGTYGSQGYLMADWDGTQDVSDLPSGVTASVVKGTRSLWATNTTDARGLQGPDGLTRNAATYYATSQVEVQLNFASAYSGNIELYAVDWSKLGRREIITVNGQTADLSSEFSQGAWVSFPISVAAGGTVTITADRTAGPNAVLSGIFLGGAGAPPAATVSTTPQGSWVGSYGTAGYLLADWNGTQDLSSLPSGVTANVVKASRSLWATKTSEVSALENPEGTSRNAATYYEANQIEVQLTFASAYSGNIELYALDWSKLSRRELITVNGQTAALSTDFSQGAWVSFPIGVAVGGTVTITVDPTAGPNAVLSGIFLG